METCRTCQLFGFTCVCGEAVNDNRQSDPGFIRVPPDQVLANQSAVHRLAMAYRGKGLSRRSVLNHLSDLFVSFDGVAVDARGRRIDAPELDVDEVFRTDNDPSERWISDFLRAGVSMPKRAAQDRVIPRLRLLWLGLAIASRNQAEMVVK